MTRGLGEHELIGQVLPDWLAVVFGLVTQLGDTWFLATLLVGLFLFAGSSRRGIAFVGGAWLAGIALYRALKVTLAWPRPASPPLSPTGLSPGVETIYELTAFASSYGFPSGHAVNSTVVYVGLATVLGVSTARKRYAGAGVAVAAVCLARIVLGLHYLVDVVAGAALALALLVGLRALSSRVAPDPPPVAFGTAIPLGVAYLVVSGAEPKAVVLLAVAIAGLVAWRRYGADLVA